MGSHRLAMVRACVRRGGGAIQLVDGIFRSNAWILNTTVSLYCDRTDGWSPNSFFPTPSSRQDRSPEPTRRRSSKLTQWHYVEVGSWSSPRGHAGTLVELTSSASRRHPNGHNNGVVGALGGVQDWGGRHGCAGGNNAVYILRGICGFSALVHRFKVSSCSCPGGGNRRLPTLSHSSFTNLAVHEHM
jgi:hypothetical protein